MPEPSPDCAAAQTEEFGKVIAILWDFDKTLIWGYMQTALFERFGVDPARFWKEVNQLAAYYATAGLQVNPETIYLNHILTYIREGIFADLTLQHLRDAGSAIGPLAPGVPAIFDRLRDIVRNNPRYVEAGVKVEHYILSTGLRAMIEGSALAVHVDGIWANDLLPDPAPAGYLSCGKTICDVDAPLSQLGYVVSHPGKRSLVFEISKGVNKRKDLHVDQYLAAKDYRAPMKQMIYVCDGPSDIPALQAITEKGGRGLGVWVPDANEEKNYASAETLYLDGRVSEIAKADYTPNSQAERWLRHNVQILAERLTRQGAGPRPTLNHLL